LPSADQSEHATRLETGNGAPPFRGTRERVAPALLFSEKSNNNSPDRETAFRYARENNVGVFYWIETDCSYAIASADLSKEELLTVATMVYKQLEP